MRIILISILGLFLYSCGGGGGSTETTQKTEEKESIDTQKANNYDQLDGEESKAMDQIKEFRTEKGFTEGKLVFYLNEEGKIRELAIQDFPFSEVRDLIAQFTSMTKLQLIADSLYESLKGIPELPELTNLENLVIKTPNMDQVLKVPASMAHVQSISIGTEQQITDVVFPENSKLKQFILPSNNLAALNPSFNTLENLEYLYLTGNLLTTFDLSNLKNLKEVVVSKNPIADVEALRTKHPGVKILLNRY